MIIKLLSIASVAAGITLGAPMADAHAGGCESAAKVTSDIWREHDTELKALGCAAVSVASGGSVPPNACLDVASKVQKVAEDMIAFWNKSAGNSWAKIGPRRLDLDEKLEGRLVSTGGRMFVTAMPLEKDTVEVKLEKLDGKAKTEVTVCKEHRGKFTKLWSFEIENGNGNKGEVYKRTLSGLKGHNLVVHLDAKSVSNTFQYELTADKK